METSDCVVTASDDPDRLDRLAATLAERSDVRFEVASTEVDRFAAYALRHAAAVEHGWRPDTGEQLEHDRFDDRALQVIGRRAGVVICCGRLVLPPGPLPTEEACGITVRPEGQVVDVGRMVVAPQARAPGSTIFLALLAALYLRTRRLGFTTGCGMMTPTARVLLRHLGITLELLGADRPYWGVDRAPVRFDVGLHGNTVLATWIDRQTTDR
jgi:N-acyl-L-homoserine lactone synthetase